MTVPCMFRIPESGRRVVWQITNACNYNCRYCMFASGKPNPRGELSTAEAFRCLDQLRASGFTHIKLTGGEPFLRRDLVSIIKYAHSLGFSLDVSTNASTINAETAHRLKRSGTELVHVSLDGPDASTHDAVRGAGACEKTMRGIQELVAHAVPVRIGTALFAGNERRLADMVEHCAAINVPALIFSLVEPSGRASSGEVRPITRHPAELAGEIAELAEAFRGRLAVSQSFYTTPDAISECPGGDRLLFINECGELSPCTWASNWSPALPLSLKQHALSELLHDKAMLAFRACTERCGRPARQYI